MILIHKDWNAADNISDVITSVLSENINSIKNMMYDISAINWDNINNINNCKNVFLDINDLQKSKY